MSEYDLIIIGAGPGGLTAGIYAARYKLKTLIIGKDMGRLSEAHKVENFPGFTGGAGMNLIQIMEEQCKALGVEKISWEVIELKKDPKGKEYEVTLSNNTKHKAKALILALGLKNLTLNVEGEKEFLGRGVSYCPLCDAAFFKGKNVGVVGGNSSAASAAVLLAQHASKVTIIYRGEKIRAEPSWTEKIEADPKIEVKTNTVVKKVEGSSMMEAVILEREGKEERMSLEGLFIEIGAMPSTSLLSGIKVETNDKGFVRVDERMKTSAPRVYAAGDLTDKSILWQAIEASAQGAVAANTAYLELKKEGLI